MVQPLHLTRPLAPTAGPVRVEISPVVLFSIVDHSMRRDADKERVIGALVGTRSDDGTEISVRNCFAVPHDETSSEQFEVDMEYHRQMYELHRRANPRDILVGWYATTSELNTFSALIQNFFASASSGTYPHPAVHLTLATDPASSASNKLEVHTYISSTVGVTPDRTADSCLFLPVPYTLSRTKHERSGLSAIFAAANGSKGTTGLASDLENLQSAIRQVIDMVERVQAYVGRVLSGQEPGSAQIGKYLLDTMNVAPSVNVDEWERMFNSHLQDVLLVVYLANTVKTQLDISARLTTLV